MNAMIAVLGGVLGGVCLFLFGWGSLLIGGAILSLARDNKRGISTPLDYDYTDDWEREFERWRG